MMEKIRNIGIIAHIDAGKTTTTERVLFYAGKEHQMGSVDEGTVRTDWYAQESDRGITIFSATVQVEWKGHRVNIIDTPGHVDFTAEVERSLRVLDGAVVVFDGVAGVQAQSETVWRQADTYHVPRICFINKLDRIGADFHNAVGTIEDRLGATAIPIQIPIGIEDGFIGVVDLIHERALYFEGEQGEAVADGPIPDDLVDEAGVYREQMLERLADLDEDFLTAMVEDGEVGVDQIHRALRQVALRSLASPVLAGSALRNKGVQPLLDAVCAYLPAPVDVPPMIAWDVRAEEEIQVDADPKGEPVAYAFKTASDQHGEITYLRIYSGTITNGMQLFNSRVEKVERMAGLCRMYANKVEKAESVSAGEIAAVRGLRWTSTSDTLCLKKHPVELEKLTFPETVIRMSVEPRTSGDREKLELVLGKLAKDDPTFQHYTDSETGQLIVSGMGELHLDVLKTRMLDDFKVDCVVGKPRVSYKETIREAAEGEGKFDRKVGEKQLFARVRVRVEPCAAKELQFTDRLPHDAGMNKSLRKIVRDTALGAADSGPMAGYPMIRMRISLLDAEWGDQDPEQSLPAATSHALRNAIDQAGEQLLEPIMQLEVEVPEGSLGDVLGDLKSRRATITDMPPRADRRAISATVPISTMFGYASKIRSLTQGRESWSMEPFDFAEVPADVADRYTI